MNISVIIPIYNGAEDLPDLLTCLQEQTYPASQVEYILVNNNSRDRTGELLATAVDKFAQKGLVLLPLNETEVQGSYAARNAGIRAAKYDIFAFTDADCRPCPQWLELLVKPFENPEIGLVAGEIQALPSTNWLERYSDRKETLSQKHTLANSFCPYGQTANLAIRKQAFEQVGLFRPYLTTGGDADICWRILRETDWKLEFMETAFIRHRHRSTLSELRSQWRRYGRSNRYLHELHGVELMPEQNLNKTLYRLSRWILKEIPLNFVKLLAQKADFVDIMWTPLDLITYQARSEGQKTAKLPEEAKEITPF
ncbi:glycosyltransferase [Spirulina sp. 06S082]|uniref:glycosyltransferase n=1 Tax=Spirulina sp. 06S082 TaxID=3110248 RepID=UPI002B206FE9|nr:glycosyltransferase [Spirulina sp. 06S082]MEA5471357.1 glycosyltransferase [Spirulina sp. 06S082]